MEVNELVATRSCHHGDFEAPNELAAALRVSAAFPEIDVFEIDFVCDGTRIVSSHDYASEAIARGSALPEWIEAIVVERGRTLWLDVKENLDIQFAWAYGKFDAALLFTQLAEAGKKWGLERLRHRIWVGCQEAALRRTLMKGCETNGWHFILDMPSASAYVCQMVTPRCCVPQLNAFVDRQMHATNYHQCDIISIDKDFFKGSKELKRFVAALNLRPGVIVVLNSFPRSQSPLLLEDHRIVMQYDYTA